MNKAILFKVKEGKKNTWYSWCSEINTFLQREAIETLAEEKILNEITLGFSLHGTDYVIGYVEGDCLPANMDRNINIKHKRLKEECLERVSDVDILYNLKGSI